jgi:hypothetical protein
MIKTAPPGKGLTALKTMTGAMILFAGIMVGFVSAEEGFPGIAVALSVERFEAEIRQISSAENPLQQLVLPPLQIAWTGALDLGVCRDALRLANQMIPGRIPVWLRLRLTPPPPGTQGPEIEDRVKSWVAALKRQIDFDFDGLILDADETISTELGRLVVLSCSVTLKSGLRERLIAIPGAMMDALGPAAGAYVDRYTFKAGEAWPAVMRRFAEAKILRPAFVIWDGSEDPGLREAYLESVLTSRTYSVDLFIVASGRPERLGDLLATGNILRTQIPSQLTRLQDDNSRLYVARQDGSRPRQAVFVDALLDNVVILAKIGEAAASPRPLRYISVSGDTYSLTCLDPLMPGFVPGKESLSTDVLWDRPYVLLRAKKSAAAGPRFTKSVEVTARADLSVDEIIAHWRLFNNRQKQFLKKYAATVEMDLHFQPPSLGSGFDVSLHYTYFWKDDGSQYWLQTAQYLNGIKLPGRQTFPLPMIEPDKIVVRPLELRLVDDYIYALDGRETVRGIECYAVSFKPQPEAKESLYAGKIWIDASAFRGVQMLLIQTGGTGSITGHRELQTFDLIPGPGEYLFNVLVRSDVEQKVLAAGREFLLERKYRFHQVEINAEGYEAALQEALRSENPMLTETASGLRELVKDASGARNVQEKVKKSVWSLMAGTLYDGTYSFPVPLLGVSAIDGDFLRSGGQFSVFWAGPILALNYSKKSRPNLTLGADLFLTALPRRDRVVRSRLEVDNEGVSFYSESLGARLQWQPWAGISVSTTAYLTYELFRSTDQTSPDFVLPRNGWTVNPNVTIEYSHKGYLANFAVSLYDRLGWKAWGLPASGETPQTSFTLAYARIGKQFYPSSFTRAGLELSYYTGSQLDRFSSYQPSVMSSPKIRGIPSGTVSLRNIGSAQANLGFTLFDVIRMDAYYSFAKCTEQSSPARHFDFQGLEFDFGTIGPWRSYIQGVVAFALKGLPAIYRQRWSAYLLIFIPFK